MRELRNISEYVAEEHVVFITDLLQLHAGSLSIHATFDRCYRCYVVIPPQSHFRPTDIIYK